MTSTPIPLSSGLRLLRQSGCLCLLLATTLGSKQATVFPDCLNGSSTGSQFVPKEHPSCTKDTMSLGDELTTREGEKLLGLTPSELRFIGCDDAPFITVPALGLSNSTFTIYYPTGVQLARNGYVAPLLHEMGHVFQLKQAGSPQRLRASLEGSNERIELGADFIAGFEADHLRLEPNAFLLSLSLFGSYNHQDLDYHGRPEDRAASFRNGYFYQNKQSTLGAAYADFQDNRFAQITHS